MQHYETIDTREVDGFTIVLSVTPEDIHPRDVFDETIEDMQEMCRKIDNGTYEWFIARVQAYKKGVLLGTEYLGGNLYDSSRDFVDQSGGYYEDMTASAIAEAKKTLESLLTETQGA